MAPCCGKDSAPRTDTKRTRHGCSAPTSEIWKGQTMTRLGFRKITLSLVPAVPSLPAAKTRDHCQPGATPQDLFILPLNRAFSALLPRDSNSWGVVAGWSEQGTVGAK